MPTPVHRALAALALAASFVTPAGALPLVLQATSRSASVTSFTVGFDDRVGDGLLRLDEMTSFSGVDFPCDPGCGVHETRVLIVPDIAGVSAGSGNSWGFASDLGGGALSASADSSLWSYATAAAVPEPPALWTVLAGAAAIATLVGQRRPRLRSRLVRAAS